MVRIAVYPHDCGKPHLCPFRIGFSHSSFMTGMSGVSEDTPDPCTQQPIRRFRAFSRLIHIDTGLPDFNTRSEISTFVTKGRFPLFVNRYEASVPLGICICP